jgi:hypothetical protein
LYQAMYPTVARRAAPAVVWLDRGMATGLQVRVPTTARPEQSGVLVVAPAALLHLEQGRDRPAGRRRCGGGLRAARRPAGPAAGRADRRGDPGLGAAGHDLRAHPTRRPAPAPARPRVPAPVQWPPTGRPVPAAADIRRLRDCPRRTPTVRTATAAPEVSGVQFGSHPDTAARGQVAVGGVAGDRRDSQLVMMW